MLTLKSHQNGYKATTAKGESAKSGEGKEIIMKTSIVNVYGKKMFVVDTEIAMAAYRPGITNLKVVDDKGSEKFLLGICMESDNGYIGDCGIQCNGVTDGGNLAVLIKMFDQETLDDVKAAYGAKLVVADKYLSILKEQMISEASAVDAIFAGAADVAVEVTDAE